MDFTVEVAKAFNLSPFDVLHQDKDDVIMMINYFIEKGDVEESEPVERRTFGKEERIRVNDKTATGGWF